MNPLDIRTLEHTPLETIHAAWVKAFADYQVALDLSLDTLAQMFRQESVLVEASVGAFDGAALIGFWMNGVRGPKAYDAGTALVPEYRGRGVSKLLAAKSTSVLRQLGVTDYTLEVLCQNEKAYRIYLQDGFHVTRKLRCLKTEEIRTEILSPTTGIRLQEQELTESLVQVLPAPEYVPTWQNETQSMLALGNEVTAVVAWKQDQAVGYGLIAKSRGRVSQLGFLPDLWDTTVATALLWRLCRCSKTGTATMINIDESAQRTLRLLESQGFSFFVDQVEMKKQL